MLSCDSCQQFVADALYHALDTPRQQLLESHLATCAACRQQYQDLQQAVTALHTQHVSTGLHDDIPERVGLDKMWDSLQGELNRIDAERYRALSPRRHQRLIGISLALAASLALLVAILPLVSRQEVAVPATTASTLISPELMDYLTRAEVMLLLVANAETRSVSAVPIRQNFARDMAVEANMLNASMQNSINTGQSRLLQDIEFLLLQIANLDSSNMEQGVQLLQQYLEENSVLFKIRLLEMRTQDTLI